MGILRLAVLPFLIALVLIPSSSAQTPYAVNTLAGTGSLGDGAVATAALLEFPQAVAVDSNGQVLVGDTANLRIRVVKKDGTITTFAVGTSYCMKTDSAGNIYAVDGAFRVYKISPQGDISLFAGAGPGFDGDGGPATKAKFNAPMGVTVDAQNNVYVADMNNQRIRKITPDGVVNTLAGNGTANFGRENISATSSPLAYPSGIEIDGAGNLYIAEIWRIRKVATNGLISTIAGNGNEPNDGNAISTAIGSTVALAMDKSNNLYLADAEFNMIRMINPSGLISTIAGSKTAGFAGDGQYGFKALFNTPMGIALDGQNNVYVADEKNHRIRKITAAGLVSTIAGASHFDGDGGAATKALLHRPEHAIKDAAGNLFIADTVNNRIRKVDASGVISTVAGYGECDFSGDLLKAVTAGLCGPNGLAFDVSGNLYIADSGTHRVRRIDSKGTMNTVAGSGATTGPVTTDPLAAALKRPYGLAYDPSGQLYVSDQANHWIWALNLNSAPMKLNAVAGNGTAGNQGDGGLATAANLNGPTHLAVGSDGSLYIADSLNEKVRKVVGTPSAGTGVISTVLSAAALPSLQLAGLDGIAVDAAGNLYATWVLSDVITVTTPNGQTRVIGGNGDSGFAGDGGLALSATFNAPSGISVDTAGDLYVADWYNNRIRKLTLNTLTGVFIVSGEQQRGMSGMMLPLPLVVGLSFRGGVGVAGIPVTFTVTSGSATVSQQTTNTDSKGLAGVTVMLGNVGGPIVVTASIPGASSVQFHLTAITTPVPTIDATGIVGAGGSTPAITQLSPGGFATIFGTNFAPAGTFATAPGPAWTTKLANVCVNINNTPAFITFVSPSQINLQVPDIPVGVNVTVQVVSNCGAADEVTSGLRSVASLAATPEFLYWLRNPDGKNPAVTVDAVTGAYVGAAGLIPGAAFTPAKPGQILTIYGVSFGPTTPASTPGTPPTDAARSAYAVSVKFGPSDLPANLVYYAGVSPGTPGLYQLNIQVPIDAADGDYGIQLTLGNFKTPAGAFITVKK